MRQATGSLDGLLGLAQLFRIPGHRNDRGTVGGQMERCLPAESSPRAGDQGHFAFQLKAHFAVLFDFFFGLAAAVSK